VEGTVIENSTSASVASQNTMPSSLKSARYDEDPQSYFGFLLAVFFVFVFGVSIGHCWWVGDQVAMVSIVVIGVGCFLGYCYGLWKTIGSSAGASLGLWLAEPTSTRLVPYLERFVGQSLPASVSVLVSGLAIAALVTMAFWMVGVIVFRRSGFLKRCDRYSGFLFGFGNSVAIVALILWGLIASESAIKQMQLTRLGNGDVHGDKLTQGMDQVLTATKSSYVMVALGRWNPYLEVPQFQEIKRQLDQLIIQRSSSDAGASPLSSLPAESSLNLQKLIQVMSGGQPSSIK
jgi:uncharacterized membrane protein required for colicin V production